jgi:hypothetical protein
MSSGKFELNRMFVFSDNEWPDPYALRLPFVVDGHLYATDGRVAARVPTDAANTVIPGLKFPNPASVFSGINKVDPLPMPQAFVGEHRVRIEGAWIAIRYWVDIAGLPGVKLVSKIEPGKAIAFVFDYEGDGDGEVVVMPCYDQGE